MAKITRKTQVQFGGTAGPNQIGQFGSFAATAPAYTTDPNVIQALSQFQSGWFAAVINGNAPCIEDFNALEYLWAYQLGYLLQQGVAEWDPGTTYFIDSIVQAGGALFLSLTNNNLNNAAVQGANWYPLPVLGTSTNDSAAAGDLGEYIESYQSTTAFPATGTWGNLTSISLTPGDWDVTVLGYATINGSTTTAVDFGISTTTGNVNPGIPGFNEIEFAAPTSTNDSSGSIPNFRMSLSATTTVYLKYFATYSAGTPHAYGTISARRRR